MKIGKIGLRQCSICANRDICIAEDYPFTRIGPTVEQRDYLYIEKGDYIFKKEEYDKGVFCLYSGEAKVFDITEENKEVIIKNATDGNIIGYNSIVDGKYIHSAIATDSVFVCHMKTDEIQQLIKEHKLTVERMLG